MHWIIISSPVQREFWQNYLTRLSIWRVLKQLYGENYNLRFCNYYCAINSDLLLNGANVKKTRFCWDENPMFAFTGDYLGQHVIFKRYFVLSLNVHLSVIMMGLLINIKVTGWIHVGQVRGTCAQKPV
jgi:hypothetical protein